MPRGCTCLTTAIDALQLAHRNRPTCAPLTTSAAQGAPGWRARGDGLVDGRGGAGRVHPRPLVDQEVIVMARPPHTVRGSQRNLVIPSSTPKFKGPNFGVTGWTVVRGRLWWEWHRQWAVVNSSTVSSWGGTIAFGLFETGSVIPGPESSTNADWVHWQPVTGLDNTNAPVWYDAGTPASTIWPLNAGYFEWKTPRTAPGNGMDLWWCWDFPSTFGSSDRVSWAWDLVYLSL